MHLFIPREILTLLMVTYALAVKANITIKIKKKKKRLNSYGSGIQRNN